jgi:hypothetical protein
MADHTIRELRDLADGRPQYELWLRATESLPRAWRSCLRNVEHQLQHGLRYPGSRLYAERPDGTLLGYIATHPPFEWIASQHGPPARSLGWAIPFGFPWTDPLDTQLEIELYDAMIRALPEVYGEFTRDIYIQRFRESWSRQLAFLEQSGWRLHERLPLFGREIGTPSAPTHELIPIARDDLGLVSALSHEDPTNVDKLSIDDLQQRYDGGWIASDTFWRLAERGAFAVEQRGRWAGVTFLAARPDAWDETLQAAATRSAALGATEIYFTIEAREARRREALEKLGFREVDAGVYYLREAD